MKRFLIKIKGRGYSTQIIDNAEQMLSTQLPLRIENWMNTPISYTMEPHPFQKYFPQSDRFYVVRAVKLQR
jgi:hypothetical protein